MPDPLFQSLFDETDALRWTPADVVRERARRRTRRTRMAAVTAAVVAVAVLSGGVAVAQLGRPASPNPGTSHPVASPTPSSTPPASPTAPASPPSTAPSDPGTAIVDAMLLQPADVGSGYHASAQEVGSGDWTFEFSASQLQCPSIDPHVSPLKRRDWLLSRGTPQAEDIVSQFVARYRPGDADRYLDEVRARVNACEPAGGKSIKIGAQRFAGQDALLIEVNYGDGYTAKQVLVRQGDLLTEFFTKPERDSATTQDLGRKAAIRLCAGAPTC